jgi:hypothetical protein
MKKKTGWIARNGILTRGTPARDRLATAVHEAGHAVIAERMGEIVTHVMLVMDRPQRGLTVVNYRKRHGRIDPLTRAIVALAGHEAEHRFYGRPINALPPGDYEVLVKLGCSNKSINTLGWFARRHVCWFERDIRRVARELLRRGSLSRRQFLAALKGHA